MYNVEKIKQIPLPVIAERETGVTLKEHGNSRCPCAGCGTKSNHFKYYPVNNSFKCWYSGTGGTSIDLIKHIRGITDNGEAMEYLNQVYLGGGAMEPPTQPHPEPPTKPHPEPPAKNDREVYSTLLDMCKGVHDATIERYLDGRGIVEPLRERYHICTIPAGGVRDIRAELIQRFGVDRLKAAGVISVNGWFVFSDYRLLLPSMYEGKCLYIHGRLTDTPTAGDEAPKYKYLGGVPRVPFLLDNLNSPARRVYIVEGFFDAVCATEIGCPAIGLGSCHYKKENYSWLLRKLQRKGKSVVISYDNDTAGQNALSATIEGKPLGDFCASIGLTAYSFAYNKDLQGCKDWNEYYLLCIDCINKYLQCASVPPGEPTAAQLVEQVATATNTPRHLVKQIIENL